MYIERKRGFTLIELSIVLVIIALLVGGIMVGRSLIRSSELQGVMQEYAKYTQAVRMFRDKYMQLPGDFTGATALWGASSGSCPQDANIGTETCNGDGDGRIGVWATQNSWYEPYRAWQHMGNAQMIDGGFSGIMSGGTWYRYTMGTDIPRSKLAGAGWKFLTATTRDIANGEAAQIPYTTGDTPPNLTLRLGGAYFENSERMSGIVTPIEAQEIDSKMDDGYSTLGTIVSQDDTGMSACDNGSTGYSITTSAANSLNCVLVFKTGL